jgi:muramidase (phage lysozyme)
MASNNELDEEQFKEFLKSLGATVEDITALFEKMKAAGKGTPEYLKAISAGVTKLIIAQENHKKAMDQSSSVLNGFSNSVKRAERESNNLQSEIIKLRNQVESTTDSNEKARLMQEKAAKEAANFYIEGGKVFSEGIQIMAGGALKTLSNALTNSATSILNSHSGMSSATQLMRSGIDVVNSAAQGGASTLKTFGAATAGAGGKIGKLGVFATFAGGALSSFSTTLTGVAKSGMDLLYTQTNQLIHGFTSMASAGSIYTGSMKSITDRINASGLTVEQFAKVTSSSKDALMKTGLGISEGSKRLVAAMQKGGEPIRNGMLALGFSMEEQAEMYAETMANMAGPRGKLVASDTEVAAQTAEYARNLRLMSDLTGKNIKQLQEEGAARTSDAAMQIEFSKMSANQAARVTAAFAVISATEAKALKSSVIYGQNIDKDSAILENQMPALKAKMDELRSLYARGKLTESEAERVNADYKQRIQEDAIRQKQLAVATTENQTSLNTALADIINSNRKAVDPATYRAKTEEVKKIQETGTAGLEKGSVADIMAKSQDHAMQLQKIASDHLDKYTKILTITMDGMTDAIKEFAKVLNGTTSPTDLLKSIGTGIIDNLGTIALAIGGVSSVIKGIQTITGASKQKAKNILAEEAKKHTTVPTPEPTVPGRIKQSSPGGKKGKHAGGGGAVSGSPSGSTIGDGAEAMSSVASAAGSGIISGVMEGLAAGLTAFANPLILKGAAIFAGSVTILAAGAAASIAAVAAGISAGAWMLGKALPTLADGFKSFSEINGANLVEVGKGLGLLALGLGGFAATSVLTAVGGVFNKISDFLGVGVSSVIESMKQFSSSEIKADVVKTNAEAFVAFSNAMASYKGTSGPGVLTALTQSLGEFFSGGAPFTKLIDFQTYNFNKAKIIDNAEAFTAFSNALASYKGASGVDFATAMVMSKDFFTNDPPLKQLEDFANIKLKSETITRNANAFVAFSNALAQYKGASGIDFGTVMTSVGSFLTKSPPLELFQEFAKIELKSDVITKNANAFVLFSDALSKYKGTGAPGLFESLSKAIGGFFTGGPPIQQMETFGNKEFKTDNIKKNAEAFAAFSNALASYKGTSSPGIFESISKSVGVFFSGGLPFDQMKAFGEKEFNTDSIKKNAEAFVAFSNALASYKGASGVDFSTALLMSTDFFSKGLPFKQLEDFSKIKLESDVITRNANAFVAFSNALASYKGASGVDFTTAMVMSKDFFEKDPPLAQLIKFAAIDLDSESVSRNAKAFVAFSNALSQYKGASGVDFTTAIVMSRTFFKDSPPLTQLAEFAAMTIDPVKIETNTTAFVKFSNALASFTGFGSSDVVGTMIETAKKLFSADPFSKMKDFGDMKFNHEAILKNAETFQKFATAMSTYAGAGSKFVDMKVNVDEDAKAIMRLDDRMKSLIDRFKSLQEQLSKLGANFNVIFTKDGEAKISAGTGTISGGTVVAPSVTTTPKPEEKPVVKSEPQPVSAGANAVAGGAVNKPGTAEITSVGVKGLLERIAKGEGTADEDARKRGLKSGYDVSLGYGMYGGGPKKALSDMTFAEVKEYQKKMLADPKNTQNSSAVGKYQFISATLAETQKKLGISDDAKFDAAAQDKMAMVLLKRRGFDKVKSGNATQEQIDKFQEGLAAEWASIADPRTKRSKYNQHVGTTDEQIKVALSRLTATEEVKTSEEKKSVAEQVAANTKAANAIEKKTIDEKKSVAEQIKDQTRFVGSDGKEITGMQATILESLMNGKKITGSQLATLDSLANGEELVNDTKAKSVELAKDAIKAEQEKNVAAEETALFARKYQTKLTSGIIEANNKASKAFADMSTNIDPSKVTAGLKRSTDMVGSSLTNMSKRMDTDTTGNILASIKKVDSANESLNNVTDNFGLPKLTPKPTDRVTLAKSTDSQVRGNAVDTMSLATANATDLLSEFKLSMANMDRPFQSYTSYTAPKEPIKPETTKADSMITELTNEAVKKKAEAEEEKRMAEKKKNPTEELLKELVMCQREVANNTGAQIGIASEANDYQYGLLKQARMAV